MTESQKEIHLAILRRDKEGLAPAKSVDELVDWKRKKEADRANRYFRIANTLLNVAAVFNEGMSGHSGFQAHSPTIIGKPIPMPGTGAVWMKR